MPRKQLPAHQNWRAAEYVQELRVTNGLSRQQLAEAIEEIATKSKDAHRFTVSARSIYNIEERGQEPGPRIKFAIARFFDVPMADIWNSSQRGRIAA